MESKRKRALPFAVGSAVFSALAFLATLVTPIKVSFLTLDFKDAVIVLAAFLYGPAAGLSCSAVAALLEFVTVSTTGPYGLLMNFVSSSAFSATAAVVYRLRHTRSGALIGLGVGTFLMTAVMMPMNYFITPLYMGVSRADVAALLPTLLLPFNLAKGLFNSAAASFLYKPVASAMRQAHLAPSSSGAVSKGRFVSIFIGIAFLAAGAVILLVIR